MEGSRGVITIRINSGATRNRLEFALDKIGHPSALLQRSAEVVSDTLRNHFIERNKTPNKLGGQRGYFWAQFAHATEVGQVTDRQADVEIGDPEHKLEHKIYGGTITAKTPWPFSGFKLLTIPVRPEAYGKRAKELRLEGIKLVFIGSAAGGVLGTFAKQASQDEVYYVCVPTVTQQADPEALPPGEALEEAALQGAAEYLRTEVFEAQINRGENK